MPAIRWLSAASVFLLLAGCAHHRHEEMREAHMHSMSAASMAAMAPSLCNGEHCNVDVTVTCSSSAQCIHVAPMSLVIQNSARPSIHFRMQSEAFQFDRIVFDDPQFACTPGPREVI